MAFTLPEYHHPDFTQPCFTAAPDARWQAAERDGIAPEDFHSTSVYPEYCKIDGQWRLAEESRMDACIVLRPDGRLDTVEARNLKQGDRVLLGRTERCEEGIYLHCNGFAAEEEAKNDDQFVFRQGRSRAAMEAMIENGYCHGLLAGNALGTHDLEAACLHTALGQDIYTQRSQPNGHYHHLDVLNRVRRSGSIPQFIQDYHIDNGILYGCVKHNIPFVLTGSIRDDGPLPEVYADAYQGAYAMRSLVRGATAVICLATMLHTIAAGNMTPSFRVLPDGTVRPVYLYAVDADEFVVNKLRDRGSLCATTMVTNVQDFITKVARDLGVYPK